MSSFGRDVAFAARTLRKNPAFAVTAIATLALGIGATTAIFSVTNAVLLRPLPYHEPERLAIIWGELRARNVADWIFAAGDLKDVMDQATLFEGIAGVRTGTAPLIVEGSPPQQIRTAAATPNIFDVLGVRVARGRNFQPEDGRPNQLVQFQPGQAPAGPPPNLLPGIAILSDEFWRGQYGSDPSIIGKNIQIGGGAPVLVVGVLAPGVELHFPPRAGMERRPDVWISARINYEADLARNNVGWHAVGRMKPGVTLAAAHNQVDQISRGLWERFPLKKTVGLYFRAEGMRDDIVASVRPTIRALMGAVVFVLLIACANVANLLLVRVAGRERELAVRAALGGSTWALTRQLLAESLVLSLAGGLLGLGLAWAGVKLLLRLAPQDLPLIDTVSIDPWVLGFTMAACVVSAVLFGLVPALRASRPQLTDALRAGGRGMTGGHGALLRRAVVVAEVALSFILFIGCGLMIRSAIALNRTDPGFAADGLLTFRLGNMRARSAQEAQAKVASVRQRLGAIPGVTGLTQATQLPLDASPSSGRWGREEARADPSLYQQGQFHFVPRGYFETMRARIIAGRDFDASDEVEGARTMIIDDLVAQMAFPNESAVGKTLLARPGGPDAEPYTVVGVVKHLRHTTLHGEENESIYFQGNFGNAWLVRTSEDPLSIAGPVRAALREVDPQLLITEVVPLSDNVSRAMAPTRFALGLISVFAALAAALAAIGLYGVLANLVRQRSSEIGVRMAFGAQPSSIFRLIIGQGLVLSAFGIVAGLLGAFWLTRAMGRMLVGVTPTDPVTFASIVALFFGIAAAACWIPARRAASLEPNVALRED
ncbi:MAG: ABC transporter permease [Gemmatimonadaceae bacterium]